MVGEIGCRRVGDAHDGDARDQRLDREPRAPGKARMRATGDLEVIVVEPDRAETDRHQQHDPDINVLQVRPEQGRHEQAGEDHQAAHGRRALLHEMRLRPVDADRLAHALLQPQRGDDGGAEPEYEQERGRRRHPGAEGDVAQHVEDAEGLGEIGEPDEHERGYPLDPAVAAWAAGSL